MALGGVDYEFLSRVGLTILSRPPRTCRLTSAEVYVVGVDVNGRSVVLNLNSSTVDGGVELLDLLRCCELYHDLACPGTFIRHHWPPVIDVESCFGGAFL